MTDARARDGDERSTLRPELLLVHAEQLVARISDTGSPRTVHPRRAVSAASYAVFHYSIQWVARSAFGEHDPDAVAGLCRTFDHGDVEKVCNWVTGSPPPLVSGLVAAVNTTATMKDFAGHFLALKKLRELADYSHDVVIDRRTALGTIGRAHSAIGVLHQMDAEHPAWRAFASLVLLQARPDKKNRG